MFRSFFIAGFECASHRDRSGKRLDLARSTGHDRYALADYVRSGELGMKTVRDGLRWHLIESSPSDYDFSSALHFVRSARKAGVEVIWDLCHYGWPDHIDVFSPRFIKSFARYAALFASIAAGESDGPHIFVPINEISYLAWAAGEAGYIYPNVRGRGSELKDQLVRAGLEAIDSIKKVIPGARILFTDPVINVVAHPLRPLESDAARSYHESQFEALDMLLGRTRSYIGGYQGSVDVLGLNYYPLNQWFYGDGAHYPNEPVEFFDPSYRPLSDLLKESYLRYKIPLFIAETGAENERRPLWLRHVCDEVSIISRSGIPVEGICWYPILDNPGWDDNRYCSHGLWSYPDNEGARQTYKPLEEELKYQLGLNVLPSLTQSS